jgi:hypothetical protein
LINEESSIPIKKELITAINDLKNDTMLLSARKKRRSTIIIPIILTVLGFISTLSFMIFEVYYEEELFSNHYNIIYKN